MVGWQDERLQTIGASASRLIINQNGQPERFNRPKQQGELLEFADANNFAMTD